MRMSGELERTEKAIGIIDLGSNSVRLLLVRVHADGSTTILNQVKHMVRARRRRIHPQPPSGRDDGPYHRGAARAGGNVRGL